MTTPTQAQIEADGIAALKNEMEFQRGRSPSAAAGIAWAIERLTAAAQVGYRRVLKETDAFCPVCGHNRDTSSVSSIDHGTFKSCQKCGAEWAETATAQVGEVVHPKYAQDAYAQGYQDATDVLTKMTGAEQEAAAQVGRTISDEWIKRESDIIHQIERNAKAEIAATIERCARIAEGGFAPLIAAAIRKLNKESQ